MERPRLKCLVWNMRGIATKSQRKLKDIEVLHIIRQHDLIGIVESHTNMEDDLYIEGYEVTHNPRKKSNDTLGKSFGGIIFYYRRKLIKNLEIIKPYTPDCIWAKWNDIEGNITVMGIIYVPPGVPMIHDPMLHIKTGLLNAPLNARIVLLGDMNARVGNFEPTSAEPSFKHTECIPEEEEWEEIKWKRCLEDTKITQFGRELNRIAAWSGLECINGTHKETQESHRAGSFTCFTQIRHPSVLDQAWCTTDHKNSITSLRVLDFMPDISDHCPISLTMDGYYISAHQEENMEQDKMHDAQINPQVTLLRAEWTNEETSLFMSELEKRERKKQGEYIAAQLQCNPNRSDISLAVESVNEIILTSMETACQTWTVRKPNPEGSASKPDQPWFNRSCENAKIQMRNWARRHQSADLNQDHIYYGLRTQYKQVKKGLKGSTETTS